MTLRREQRTAKRLRAANRAAWRKAGKATRLSRTSTEIIRIVPLEEANRAYHHREMTRLHLAGLLPTYGRPRDWAMEEREARRHAVLALRQWRFLGAMAVQGNANAQAAIKVIAEDAGIENPLEVNHDQTNQSNHSRTESAVSAV